MLKTDVRSIVLAGAILGSVVACSKSPAPQAKKTEASHPAPAVPAPSDRPPESASGTPQPEASGVPAAVISRIIGKRDVTVKGKLSCKIDFVYAGFEPEDLYWDGETCASVTAKLVDSAELQRLGKWQRLDDFEKRHVSEMPGGKVLYVEGRVTASLYPVGTTRLSYEVMVAD